MELNDLHVSVSENKHGEETEIIKSTRTENKIEENTYVNTSLVVDTIVLDKRESHVYDNLQRSHDNASNCKGGCISRLKQYKDCIMLSLIGVLFIAVTILAIFIGLPEKLLVDSEMNANDNGENNIYEHLQRENDVTSNCNRECISRIKQYMDCIMLRLIGVLFISQTVLAIAIGLTKKNGINGGWSEWGSWSQCSVTCDYGMTSRERICSNPVPARGGLFCPGSTTDFRLCNQALCPGINGGWSEWGSWRQCSVTCDYGMTSRERICSNPVPARGGLFCPGITTDFRLCNQTLCPAKDGTWSDWSPWGTCSATCGTGLQSRNRTCTNQTPEPRVRYCIGDISDHQLCTIKACDGTGIGFSVYSPRVATPVKFENSWYNNYNNYKHVFNTTSGEFVCTKQGLYYFQATLIRETIVTTSILYSYCYLYVNDKWIIYFYFNSSFNRPQATGSVVVNLRPGDRIYISCNNVGSLFLSSTFSGFLINIV